MKNILLVASNPPGKVDLKLINSEVGKIYENTSGWAKITPLHQPTIAVIQDEVPLHGESKYDIVHLAGHNSEAGFYFCDINLRKPEPLNHEGFKTLFNVQNPPELVVLNACTTQEIAEAIMDIVPYIIYTSVNIPDKIALEFSDAFYQYAKDFSEKLTDECYRMAFAEAVRRTRMHNASEETFLFYVNYGKEKLNGLEFLDGKTAQLTQKERDILKPAAEDEFPKIIQGKDIPKLPLSFVQKLCRKDDFDTKKAFENANLLYYYSNYLEKSFHLAFEPHTVNREEYAENTFSQAKANCDVFKYREEILKDLKKGGRYRHILTADSGGGKSFALAILFVFLLKKLPTQ